MGRTGKADDRPLGGLRDEELARRFRESGCLAARDELLLRHLGWLQALVAALAHEARLSWADIEDAKQEILLHFLEVIGRYRDRPNRRRPFQTFARVVVVRRFCNWLRGRGRRERRHDRAVRADEWLAGSSAPAGADGRPRVPPVDEACDPARLAQRREAVADTRRVLGECDPVLQLVAERLASGASLRAIAAELARPYGRVKRLCARLAAEMQPRLAAHCG